jgi:hypothetical protein
MMEGPWCRFRREAGAREPASDIDTAVVDGLKALDPKRPIREADIAGSPRELADVPNNGLAVASRTLRSAPGVVPHHQGSRGQRSPNTHPHAVDPALGVLAEAVVICKEMDIAHSRGAETRHPTAANDTVGAVAADPRRAVRRRSVVTALIPHSPDDALILATVAPIQI